MTRSHVRTNWRWVAAVLLCLLQVNTGWADSYDDRRLRTGARLFRALLAADMQLDARIAGDGRLHVLVLADDADNGRAAMAIILGDEGAPDAGIRDIPLSIRIDTAPPVDGTPLAGVFIAEKSPSAGVTVVAQWGVQYGTIVYSPFEGHVEQGVMAGLSVEARVRPYINQETLNAAGVQLKPFFLKVAKIYE